MSASTKAYIEGEPYYSKTNRTGRNIHFGIREHAMTAIVARKKTSVSPPIYIKEFNFFLIVPKIQLNTTNQPKEIFLYNGISDYFMRIQGNVSANRLTWNVGFQVLASYLSGNTFTMNASYAGTYCVLAARI